MNRLDQEKRKARTGRPDAGSPGTPRRRAGKSRRPGKGAGDLVGLAGLVLVACALVALAVAVEAAANGGEVRQGVSVGGVALGGKTPEEARDVLERNAPWDSGRIRLMGPGGGFAFTAEELGARLDAGATAEKAYTVGRRGNVLERLDGRIESVFGTSVPAEVSYRPEATRAKIEDLAARTNREPEDASVEVSGAEVLVTDSDAGYRLDVATTTGNVERALENLSSEARMSGEVLDPEVTTGEAEAAARDAREAVSGPLVLTDSGRSWTLSPEAVGSSLAVNREDGTLQTGLDRDRLREAMAPMYADLNVEPVEAGYDVGGGATPEISVAPSGEGRRIEDEKLLDAIEEGLFEGRREYEVPVAVARPGLTTAGAEKMKPTKMLGSYRTDYSVVPDDGTRVENLGISSGAVNGTLLAPGETFSMLDHVAGLDYNDSKVIIGGEETEADGGGLCQVTSTLYNAANFAGLDVVERTPHSAQLPYIRPGMDATVWWGGPGKEDDLDMKFRNTTEGYLLLREYVAGDGHGEPIPPPDVPVAPVTP